ncbi:Six-hairpin glycosidase-like protein [Aspergillus oleicola]
MADSVIIRGQVIHNEGDSSGLLQVGTFQTALLDLIQSPSGHTDSIVDAVNNSTQNTKLPLDRLSVGKGLAYQYQISGKSTYKRIIDALRTSIDLQPRNAFGGLWYYVFPNWSYLDGMFSLLSFSPLYTAAFKQFNTTAVTNNPFHQLDLLWLHCHDNQTDLLFYGYDASKTAVWANPITVLAEDDRVVKWCARFTDLANALVESVDPVSRAWWQVLSAPGREGNYIESSGSAMFVYTLLKGVRVGFLPESETKFTAVAERAYHEIYYVHQPLVYDSVLGSAAFIRASIEHEFYTL